jgi:hypothetical protein
MSGVYFVMKIDARNCTLQIKGRQLLEADSDIGSEDFKRMRFGVFIF